MTGSNIVEPQRAKDLTKVAKGQEPPRPPHEPATVSPPPPPSSTTTLEEKAEKSHRCYSCYLEYLTCTKQKGEGAPECKKLADDYRSNCPSEWSNLWRNGREKGLINSVSRAFLLAEIVCKLFSADDLDEQRFVEALPLSGFFVMSDSVDVRFSGEP
ncbi:hypothetical protein L1887_02098 [Cichorium endivia]|nr:hypothetical protein L1887_02098 [Cichorium endivia]